MNRMRLLAVIGLFGGAVAFAGCQTLPTEPSQSSKAKVSAQEPAPTPTPAALPVIGVLGISDITRYSAVFSWTTDQPTSGELVLELAPGENLKSVHYVVSSLTLSHRVLAYNLNADTTYYAHVVATNAAGVESTSVMTTFSTVFPSGPPDSSLEVTSFSVIEFTEPGSDYWWYAPLLTVKETSGTAKAMVTKLSFTIPDLGPIFPYFTSKCVSPGQTVSLLNEIYGSFELTYDHGAQRATGAAATAEIHFEDAAGREGVVTANGPVVPGSVPTTYTGGGPTLPCR